MSELPRRALPRLLATLLLLIAGAGTAGASSPLDRPLDEAATAWVEQTLAGLSLEEKAAQTVFVRAHGRYHHPASAEARELAALVDDLEVGGIVLFASELESIPRLLGDLQGRSALPLLVAADLERGLSFRVEHGPTALPFAMAVGATRSPEAARFTGRVTGREARAVGIHWALGPVADVNNDPANPVIGLRSYGEDPVLVGAMAAAFVEGVRSEGVLTSVKHFPGHGDTGVDSHLERPVLEVDRARLETVEWPPFRAAIAAGADSVMLAHVAVPAIDPSGAPASLSPALAAGILRDEMGFEGLLVTDALEMAGVRPAWTGEAAVRALAAGADVLLLPDDPRVAVAAVARAVRQGVLAEARLDDAVRRLLGAKARLGLHLHRGIDPAALAVDVGRPEDADRAREIAAAALTLVRNEGGVLPLRVEDPLAILHLTVSDWPHRLGAVEEELEQRQVPLTDRRLSSDPSAREIEEIVELAAEHTHVVLSTVLRTRDADRPPLDPGLAELVSRLLAAGPPLVVVSFGSPYLPLALPDAPVHLLAFGDPEPSQQAVVAALFGERAIGGRLPVTLPSLAAFGDGLRLPRRPLTLAATTAAEAGFREEGLAELDSLLAGWVEQGAFPGGVVAVGHRGRLAHLHPFGRLTFDEGSPPVTADALWDVASLTKVIATTTMAMILVDEGRLDLDKPVTDYLPRFAGAGKDAVTVRHLLTHSSGIDWWAPLHEELRGQDAYVERIQEMELVTAPGERMLYSDLGVILLGEILERVSGMPLERFAAERIFAPLGMEETRFRPPAEELGRIAPTEVDPWRGRLLHGEVHDENAAALGGVAPHAGLFTTAGDLARFAQAMLWGGVLEHRRIVSRDIVEEFTSPAELPAGSSRALGWDTKSPEGSSAGSLFSPGSFGHTGYTGTSLWIDPERELFVVLLTNRVHPTRENTLIRQVRPEVHDAVVRALVESAERTPATGPVATGLDRVAAGEVAPFTGRRLGLVVHRASMTRDGRHAIDVFLDHGLEVVRLFTPEHGLRGEAAAGEAVAGDRDPASGLPVVSLYGERRQQAAEDLADLDLLVFDLQDAGARFYTYVSTLLLTLEAAAEAAVPLVVLDRPNPLGGLRIEGPVAAPRDEVPASFVNLAPGPLVHGLTLGEMARLANARLARPAELSVITMKGWRRAMVWADTGLPWVPPSPNLRTAEAALAYPGTALIEATNVNEGRGTAAPFLLLGAPWLDPQRHHVEVPGFELTPATFVPVESPAAPDPKHAGEECHGFLVGVTDPADAAPYRLGVTLLHRLRTDPAFAWRDDGKALTWLIGTPRLGEALAAGLTVDEIVALDRPDQEGWALHRRDFLLYPEARTGREVADQLPD